MRECDRFLDLSFERDPADDAALQQHAARCPACREQMESERELRRLFHGIPRPGPSLHFNRVLRERLRAERERQRRGRWRLLVMQGYWVAASLASAAVLILIRWPGDPLPAIGAAGAAIGMVLIPAALLLLSLRIGPVRLLIGTMRALRP